MKLKFHMPISGSERLRTPDNRISFIIIETKGPRGPESLT